MSENLYSAKELSEKIGIHPVTIRKLAAEGKIPRIKIGNVIRFDLEDVLKQCKNYCPPEKS